MKLDKDCMRTEAVDFVIAWVDGDDPVHLEKRIEHLGQERPKGADSTRFANGDEIYYCLLSVRKFASWVNRVYIVTDDQIPEALTRLRELDLEFSRKIIVVDHKVIFAGYSEYLPTFNSIAIGSMLWRIPGLSEHFVYLNDDIFLCSQTTKADFFSDGSPVYRGHWIGPWYSGFYLVKTLVWTLRRLPIAQRRASFKDTQLLASKAISRRSRFFAMGHTPHPARVTSFREMFSGREDLLRTNIGARFRAFGQFSAFAAVRSFDIARCVGKTCNDFSLVFLRGEADSAKRLQQKLRKIESGNYLFACINGLDQVSGEVREEIVAAVSRVVE
jgi:hypothetical protein